MTTSNDRACWEIERAKESIASLADEARTAIRAKIAWIRRSLDEAERRLDADQMPNTCGILQSSAMELEMALARLTALRDAAPSIRILADAADASREGTR
jgi:shikimate kinase